MKNRILSLVLVLMFAVMGLTAHANTYVPNEVLVQLQPSVNINAFNLSYNTTTLSSAGNNTYCLGTATGVDDSALATAMSTDSRVVAAGPNEAPNSQFIFAADGTNGGTGVPIVAPTGQFIFAADGTDGTGVPVTAPTGQFIFAADGTDPTGGPVVGPNGQFIFAADADDTVASQFIFSADQFIFSADQFIFTADQFIFSADKDPGLFAYMSQATSSLIHYGTTSKKYNGSGVLVAVLDTGISTRNPLLAAHVTNGWNFIDGTSNADDRPSGIDSNGNGIPDEDAGHGTMVAGLINRYAQGATLLPIKVLDSDGSGSLWATVQGIRYAIARGAKVINMSFGSSQNSPVLRSAIKDAWKAGIIIITAAGNNGSVNQIYPAGDNMTIAVGSTDATDVKASFSNYGAWVDVVAPGVGLPSTFWNGNYAVWSGTSFSSPLVAAEAALIMSAKPNWTPAHVRNRIKNNADSVDALNLPYAGLLGAGIIDLDAALSGL